MYSDELDFRYDWVSLTFSSFGSGFKIIEEKANSEPWFDRLWQMEYAENILGVAFVVAQTYILGTVEDVNKIRDRESKASINKIDFYSDNHHIKINGVSSILLINSIANYYKHHDEWDMWPTNLTGEVLAGVGITKDTEFPYYVAATKLRNENEIGDLKNLLKIISTWRGYILLKHK